MADEIQVSFVAVGQQRVVSAFDQVSSASLKSEQTIKRFDATNDAAFKRLNEGVSRGARAIGVFSMAASAAEPALGKLGSAAMRTAETVMSFGTYLGGPWGIALGAAVAATSLFASALNNVEEQAKQADAAVARLKERNKAAAEAKEFAEWSAPQSAIFFPGDPRFKDALNKHGAKVDKRGRLIDPNAPIGGPAKGPGAGPEFEAMQRREENEARMRALTAADAESRARVASADAMMAGRGFEDPSKAADATRAKLDREFDLQREHNERMKSQADEINDHYEKLDQQAMERAQLVRSTASAAFGAVASSAGSALNKLAAGQKTSVKEFIGGIGQALVAQGTADMARAGAMFFDPLRAGFAPGLLAAAGVEIAVGMGMGAAGASGGGGGGGARAPHARRGESGGDYLDRTRAESPSARRGGGGGTTVVQQSFNVPTVISYTDEQARAMQRAAREGARHGVRV